MRFTFNNTEFTHNMKEDFLTNLHKYSKEEVVGIDGVSELITDYILEQYLNYCNMKDFTMDSDVAATFDFMGVSNTNNYPLGYWKCKLQDNLIRERFNKDRLYSDPMFGLTDVSNLFPLDLLKHLKVISDHLCDGCYLAGGSLANLIFKKTSNNRGGESVLAEAYSALKYQYRVKDLDIFMTDDIDIVSELDRFYTPLTDGNEDKSIYYVKSDFSISSHISKGTGSYSYITQFILRKYRSPNEIVYGFDIDASGLILVEGKIYATHCAEYAIRSREIYFDSDRSSPSYTKRLIKYGKKGYNVKVPQIDWNKVNYDTLNKIRTNCRLLSGFGQCKFRNIVRLEPFTALLIYLYYGDNFTAFCFSPNSNYDVKGYSFTQDSYNNINFHYLGSSVTLTGRLSLPKLSDCINLMPDKYKKLMEYKLKDTDPMSQITGSMIPEVTSFEEYSDLPWIYGKGCKEKKLSIFSYQQRDTNIDLFSALNESDSSRSISYFYDFITVKFVHNIITYDNRDYTHISDQYIYANDKLYHNEEGKRFFKEIKSKRLNSNINYFICNEDEIDSFKEIELRLGD